MRKFIYFLTADARHLQTRLERLAAKGLELTGTEGFFTGAFAETKRTDLKYLVLPYGAARNFTNIGDYERFGWEVVGGFNGMAILKSLPCVEPDAEGAREQMQRSGCLRPDRFTVPLLAALAVAWAVLLFGAERRLALEPWYLSYFSLSLRVVQTAAAALAVANLATLRSYLSAWVHGLTLPVMLECLLLMILMRQLDESDQTAFFVVILLILAVASFVTLWWRCRPLAAVMTGACLLVLCLGLLFPNVNRVDLAGTGLHREMADQPVLQLSDLGVEDALTGTSCQTGGTFLVRETCYGEWADSASVSSEVWRCLTGSLADRIVSTQLRRGNWTGTDDGWSTSDGKNLLLRRGNTVALVTYTDALTEEQIQRVYAEMFGP